MRCFLLIAAITLTSGFMTPFCRHSFARSTSPSTSLFAANFYGDLGVSQSASAADIKSAFRAKARKLHPDVNPSPDAKEKFQKINRAYEVLSDPKMKQRYDQFGEAGVGSSAASEGGGFGGGQQVSL